MVFHKDAIYIYDTFNIALDESALIRIEDGIRDNVAQLLTIDASHYGFFNRNGCIYRHDTVQYDIPSFVYPNPKPIIEGHKQSTSDVFGNVVAADYVLTDYYKEVEADWDIEGLDSEEYIMMCKDAILPRQAQDPSFNGLAFVQVVGKLDHEGAIKKVLDQEFLTVSIGAIPKKMICSECLQDQTERMCNHYANRRNGIFMLAESLEYEELSFVKKPADPFGRVVKVHDGQMEESVFETDDTPLKANVNVIDVQSFFENVNSSEKKIVCVDNICTVINDNQEDGVMNKINVSLLTDFGQEKLASLTIKLADSEDAVDVSCFDLKDEDFKGMKHTQFAVIQKTPNDEEKRRLPLHDEAHVRAGLVLINDAEDLSESELEKAIAKLNKAARKFGIEIEDAEANDEVEAKADTELEAEADTAVIADAEAGETVIEDAEANSASEEAGDTPSAKDILLVIEDLKTSLSEFKEQVSAELKDGIYPDEADPEKNPITKIFDLLKWFANDVKWAGESLNSQIGFFLEDEGKKAISKAAYDEIQTKVTDSEATVTELQDKVQKSESEMAELQEEVELLDQQNVDLNYKLREQSVNEIISHKVRLAVIEDTDEALAAEKEKLFKLPINALTDSVGEYRHLSAKIKESDVNNNMNQLNTVDDPTLTDGEIEDIDANLDDGEQKVVSKVDVKKALQSLRPNAFGNLFGEKEL